MRLKLSQPSLAGVGAGAELGKIIYALDPFMLHLQGSVKGVQYI